jgi:hypothetical protein
LKNFSFSLIAALYIFLTGWFFTRSGNDVQKFFMFAFVASPLIWLAFYAQGKRIGGFSDSALKSHSILSHLAALGASVFLFLFVKSTIGAPINVKQMGPVSFFGNFQAGWDFEKGATFLAILIVAAASAVTIWSGRAFAGKKSKSFMGKGPRLFFAGLPEITRLLLNLYFFTFLWALGALAVSALFKDDMKHITIITARALLPLIILVPFAVLRIPVMGIASLIAVAAIGYLMKENSAARVTAVFLGFPLAALAAFMGIRFFTVPAYVSPPPPRPAAEPGITANNSPQEKITDK